MTERRKRRVREGPGRAAAGEQPSRTVEARSDASPPNSIEEAYRALVEQSLQGLFIFQDGQVVFANQAMADITGYSVEELVALSPEQVYTLVHPDDREAVWSRYRRRMAGQAALQRYEFRSLHKDGGVRWLEAHASLIEYAGRPAVQAAYVDITSRKRAEESLRASEDRYRSLFDNAVLGIYRTTPDGRILAANPALLRMLGYDSLEDLTQRNLEEDGFEAGYPRSLFKELMESRGEVIGLESAWTRRDGTTVYIRESAVAIRDEAGKSRYYEGTVEDISDRKQAEAARKLSHRILEISNRSTMREPMLQQIVLEIRDFAQCENAAIRILDEDGNIPYEACVGFSREFYERESPLSIQRDQCMCIRVIQGRTDSALPFFTPRGSFFMNGTTRFLAAVPAQEKGQTRNVCNEMGFESVALIPIQSNGQIVGLIHVADRRENRVPLSLVEPLEDVAMQLGIAVRRTMAEEALRRSEQDKSLILNSTSETFAYLDLDLRIQWGNRMLAQSLGLPQEQIIGRHCYEVRHQRTTPCDYCPLVEAIRTGKPQEAEVYAPDGQVLFLRGFPLLADDGRITGVVEIGENTTARKRAQQALQESEAKFRAIADYTGDVEIWSGPDGQLIWINPAIERFTGYTVSECMAMPDFPASLIHVEDRPRMLGLYQQACAGSSGNDVHYRLIRRDGSFLWASVSWQPIFGLDGAYLGWRSCHRDVTDRVQAEEALRLSEAALQAAQKVAHVGSWSWHIPVGRVDWSEEMFRIFGVSKEQFSGNLADIVASSIHPEDKEAVNRVNEAVITEYRHSPLEFRIIRPDGSVRVAWAEAGELTLDKHGRPLLLTGIVQDITEQKRAQQRAEQRQAELLHVSRLSTLGEMASGFAHELNQPLSAIMSYASASLRSVQANGFDADRLATNLGHIIAQSGRAGEIIRRVRAFAQRRPLRLGALDLNATVREAVDLLGVDIRHKGVELTLDLSPGLPSVFGDSIQIEQVLLNLMRNAVEAMEAVAPQQRSLLLRSFSQSHDAVAVAVSDTGPGMSEEMMAKAFDAFFTTKEKGLGIGLSISRSIIESHRGQFWVTSGPDGGCTFTFTLPAAAPADQNTGP